MTRIVAEAARSVKRWFDAHRPSVWLANVEMHLNASLAMADLGDDRGAASMNMAVVVALHSPWGRVVSIVAEREWMRVHERWRAAFSERLGRIGRS